MLDKLFNSKTRVAVLGLFFNDEDKKSYIQEIIKSAKTDAANTHRELDKLEKLGILKSKKQGNQKYYFLNKDNAYFEALKRLFAVYRRKDDGWYLLEEIPNGTPTFVADVCNSKLSVEWNEKKGFKYPPTDFLTIYRNGVASIYFVKSQFDKYSRSMLDGFIADPASLHKVNEEIIKQSDSLRAYSQKVSAMNLKILDDKELGSVFSNFYREYERTHMWAWPHTAPDFGEAYLSKYSFAYLNERLKKTGKNYSVGEIFSKLTSPTEESNAQKEYRDLLAILDYILKEKSLSQYFAETETRFILRDLMKKNEKAWQMIVNHTDKYGWLGYGLIGPGWSEEYFIDILCSLIRQQSDPQKLLAKIEAERKELAKEQENIFQELKIDDRNREFFIGAKGLVFTKGYRKDSLFYFFSVLENILNELCRRYYLSMNQARMLFPHEIEDILGGQSFDFSVLNDRQKLCAHYSAGRTDYWNDTIVIGAEAEKLINKLQFIEEDISDIKILNGECASPGKSRGRAVIVNVTKDMQKMKDGDILISIATNPDLVPAIKRASAIVTDVGGITCHAAIISRELGVPCVIGTKYSTKVLKDGDIIEVDATHGKVTIIKRA
ncbi:MAG: PEP-utilizing enzyme [Patescibacteria group bacterium]